MLDAILLPIGEGNRVLNLVSTGSLLERVEIECEGDHRRMKDAINNLVDNLTHFASNVAGAADQVASGSQQLSSSSEQVSEGATEQAAAAEEASASMEQMAANIKQNADNATQTEKIARQSSQDAEQSGQAVPEGRDRDAHHRREDRDRAGNRPPDRPAGAERGGRGGTGRGTWPWLRGRGGRSPQAGRAQPVGGGRDQRHVVGHGFLAATQAGEMLTRLVPDIRRTAELVAEISAACREQDIGASQINEAIQQLDKVTQQNASASDQISSTSGQLASQAEELQESIAFFQVAEDARPAVRKPVARQSVTTTRKAAPRPGSVGHQQARARVSPST